MSMIVDSFQSGSNITRKTQYADLKREILKAGKFSSFEATANNHAASLFTDLCRDPEIETFKIGYPWTGVRLRPVTLVPGGAA